MIAQHILAVLWLSLVGLTYARLMKTHEDAGSRFRIQVIASGICLILAALIFWLGAFSAYPGWFVPIVYPILDWLRIALVISGGALVIWAFIQRVESAEVVDDSRDDDRATTALSADAHQQLSTDSSLTSAGLVSLNQLNQLRMALSQPYPFVELAGVALESVSRVGKAPRGALYVYNEAMQEMTIAAAAGLSTEQERTFERLSVDAPVVNEVFVTGETLISAGFVAAVYRKHPGDESKPGSYALLIPIARNGDPLGLVALFFQSAPTLTSSQTATLSQMSDIIADKFVNVKLRGELARTKKKAHEREESRRHISQTFQRGFEELKSESNLDALCQRLVGIGGADAIAVLECNVPDSKLSLCASSGNFPEVSAGFEQATIQALQRRTLVLLSREKKTAEAGASLQAEREPMALVAPLATVATLAPQESQAATPKRGNGALHGLLFWNRSGRFHLAPEELQDLQEWLLPLTVALRNVLIGQRTAESAKALEIIRDLLQPDVAPQSDSQSVSHSTSPLEPLTEQKRVKRYVEGVRRVFDVSETCLIFKRSTAGQLRPAFSFGIALEAVDSLVILPGEGPLGRCAALGAAVLETGRERLAESANEYDMLNRDIFGEAYTRMGDTQAQVIVPVVINGDTRYVMCFFFANSVIAKELFKTLNPLTNLLSLILSVKDSQLENGVSLLNSAVLSDREDAMTLVNDINNDLSTIIGNCQLVADDPNLSGAVERVLRLVVERAEHSSLILRNRHGSATSDSDDNVSEDQISHGLSMVSPETASPETVSLATVLNNFATQRVVGGQILLTEGKAREVEFQFDANFSLPISAEDAETLIERLCHGLSALADEREIVTAVVYEDNGYDYLDISRRWRNLPAVGRIGSYARFEKPEQGLFDITPDLLEKLRRSGVETALDKRSARPAYVTLRVWNDARAPLAQADVSDSTQPQRILAIDDQSMILDLLHAMCDSLGYQIDTFESPTRAIAAFERGNHEIVITDVAMPEMDGWQVATAVKKLRPETYVIFITGWEEGLSAERLQAFNIDAAIKKPFRLEQLTAALEKARRLSNPSPIR